MKRAEWLAVLVLAVLAALPLWLSEHPPIQDWPQHLAAIRVLHSYSDPAFGFEQFFVLDRLRTQYLTVYYAADALAYLVGLSAALKIVTTLAIVSLPIALGSFARALGHSPSVGVMALPLAYNAHLVLGFLNFVLALPLMFTALALAAAERRTPTRHRPWLTCAVLVVCFYTHVVPFALGGIGAALLGVGGSIRETLRRVLPLALAAIVAVPWLAFSPAGATLRDAVGGQRGPAYLSVQQAYAEIPLWLTDVWRGDWDRWLLAAWAVLTAAWLASGLFVWLRERPKLRFTHTLALTLLPLGCGLAYFFAPNGHAWIWPINTRFLLLGLLLLMPLGPSPPLRLRQAIAALGGVVTALGVWCVARACLDFEREVGALDRALDRIPRAERVAGLIWSRGSSVVEFSPFLHSVAYYQAARGGAVMFTFADFPQSPFRFREDNRPPRVRPRWEWTPERVSPDRDLGWYDWVLTRGGPGEMVRAQSFELVFEARPWRLWQRRAAPRARYFELERFQPASPPASGAASSGGIAAPASPPALISVGSPAAPSPLEELPGGCVSMSSSKSAPP